MERASAAMPKELNPYANLAVHRSVHGGIQSFPPPNVLGLCFNVAVSSYQSPRVLLMGRGGSNHGTNFRGTASDCLIRLRRGGSFRCHILGPRWSQRGV